VKVALNLEHEGRRYVEATVAVYRPGRVSVFGLAYLFRTRAGAWSQTRRVARPWEPVPEAVRVAALAVARDAFREQARGAQQAAEACAEALP
jgi:hypothetical protein